MDWWNIEMYLSIRELVLTNPAFLFSFIIYLRLWEILWINQLKSLRYVEIYLLMCVCFIYCIIYQTLSIRWCLNGFNCHMLIFDSIFWSGIELFTQIIHFIFLTILKSILLVYSSYTTVLEKE